MIPCSPIDRRDRVLRGAGEPDPPGERRVLRLDGSALQQSQGGDKARHGKRQRSVYEEIPFRQNEVSPFALHSSSIALAEAAEHAIAQDWLFL